MELSREFAQVQKSAERNMNMYADAKIKQAVDVLCHYNPSMVKSDLYRTLSENGVFYTCSHERCKNQAIKKGFCEQHLQKTKYQEMEEKILREGLGHLKNRTMNFLG